MPKPLLPGQWLRVVGLTVTLLLALLPAAPPTSAAVNDTFTVGDVIYRITSEDNRTVEVAGYNNPVTRTVKDLKVPAKVTNGSIDYDVIAIGESSLSGAKIAGLILPSSITTIKKRGTYSGATNHFSWIEMPGIETLQDQAILGDGKVLVLPATLKNLSTSAISGWGLESLYFLGTEPPTFVKSGDEDNDFIDLKEDITIYVPEESLDKYKTWIPKRASHIESISPVDGGAKSVKLSQTYLELKYLDNVDVEAIVDADGSYTGTYIWSNVNPGPNGIHSPTGTYHTQDPGEETISVIVTGADGLPMRATCEASVLGIYSPFYNEDLYLKPGKGCDLQAQIVPASRADGVTLQWSTSDSKVASVDQNGNITAVGNGACRLIIELKRNGETITSDHFFVQVASQLYSEPKQLLLTKDKTVSVGIKKPNNELKSASWTSDNNSIAQGGWSSATGVSTGTTLLRSVVELSNGEEMPVTCEVIVGDLFTGEEFVIDSIKYSILTSETVTVAGPAPDITLTDVIIPEAVSYKGSNFKVTHIAESAFDRNQSIISVSLPSSLLEIGEGAFGNCKNLCSVTIPESVTCIDNYAFGSTGIKSIVLPTSLTKLSFGAFDWNESLNEIIFKGPNPPVIIDNWGLSGQIMQFRADHVPTIYVIGEEYVSAYRAIVDEKCNVLPINIPEHGAKKAWFDKDEINIMSTSEEPVNLTLNIEPDNYDGEIEWKISKDKIIDFTLDESDNKIAMIKPSNNGGGSTVITATVTSPDGVRLTSSCTVNVLFLSLSNMQPVLKPDSKIQLTGRIDPQEMNDRLTFRWSSDNDTIAIIDQEGYLKSLAEGNCKITLEALDDTGEAILSKTADLNVTSTVKTDEESLLMKVGDTYFLTVRIPNSYARYAEWSSDNESVVTFDNEKGLICAVGLGNATLSHIFQYDDGQEEIVTCPVTVSDIVLGEIITADSINYRVLTSSTVEVIGAAENTVLENITIPATIIVGDNKFNVTQICDNAFQGCNSITSVSISEGITEIKGYAFDGCSNLTSVSIPEGVTEIGQGAFLNTGLVSLTLPASLTNVVSGAFWSYNLTSLVFKGKEPPTVVDWEGNSSSLEFPNNSVIIYVPDETSVKAYKDIAGDYKVEAIVIPDHPASKAWIDPNEITLKAHSEETSTLSLHIEPAEYDGEIEWSVSEAYFVTMTLDENDNKTVTLKPNNAGIATVSATVTSPNGSKLTASCKINVFGLVSNDVFVLSTDSEPVEFRVDIVPEAMAENITLRYKSTNEDVASVNSDGFLMVKSPVAASCNILVDGLQNDTVITSKSILVDIVVPSELTTNVGSSLLMKPGESQRIYIPTGGTEWHSDWTSDNPGVVDITWGNNLTAITTGTAILTTNFRLSDGTTVPITCTVTVIVSDEFEYEGLRYRINKESETPSVELIGVAEGNTDANVNIPPTAVNGTEEYSVVGIAANAFADNQDIKSVEIPASVTSIGNGAFAGCDSLTVTMPGNNVAMGEGVFEGCSDLAVKVTPTEGGEGSEDNTTLGTGFAGTPITEVTISDEITEIAPGAFENCTELTSIVIPDQVETIGDSTFEGCTSLANVTLGSGVSTIAPDAFAGAEAITEVVCLSTTPPAFEEVAVVSRAAEGFKGFEQTVYDNATLIVPAGTEAAYKEAPIWKEFTNIQEVADVKVTVTVPEQVILFEGENFRLTPVFTPALPEGYTVSYSSDRSYVATVGENGYISAVGAGVACITVSVKDKNGNVVASATTNVAVGNDVSQLYDNVTIPVYRAMMVPLVLEPLDYLIGFMTCEAENPDIVTAYNNGSIYGNRVGETNLKMTFGLSEYSCKVKVVSEIRDIEIHTGNGTDIVPLGSPLKLYATTPDGDPVPVTWEMYSSSVASINYYTGEVTTAESGSCTIIARAVFDPELVAYYVLNVTDNPATGLTLDKSVLEMTEGETEQLTATATPANADAVIVWTSSDEAIATVGASTGEVTAVSAGIVTITATDAVTGISASCTVTVSKPSGIEGVDTAAISVRAESGRIIVKGAPADAAVEIFDIAGSRIALERGDCSVSVNAGIYVVRVAGTTIKVAVK